MSGNMQPGEQAPKDTPTAVQPDLVAVDVPDDGEVVYGDLQRLEAFGWERDQ